MTLPPLHVVEQYSATKERVDQVAVTLGRYESVS